MKYFILLVLSLVVLVQTSCDTKTEVQSPNIIFLLTDDQRADALGVAGNELIQTPNIDKLANDGVRFSNAFVTTSICCVSRASIFSGQYMRRHGIDNFSSSFSLLSSFCSLSFSLFSSARSNMSSLCS